MAQALRLVLGKFGEITTVRSLRSLKSMIKPLKKEKDKGLHKSMESNPIQPHFKNHEIRPNSSSSSLDKNKSLPSNHVSENSEGEDVRKTVEELRKLHKMDPKPKPKPKPKRLPYHFERPLFKLDNSVSPVMTTPSGA